MEDDEDEEGVPKIPLEELLDDLTALQIADEEMHAADVEQL